MLMAYWAREDHCSDSQRGTLRSSSPSGRRDKGCGWFPTFHGLLSFIALGLSIACRGLGDRLLPSPLDVILQVENLQSSLERGMGIEALGIAQLSQKSIAAFT
jgi:hypothetical protein